MAGRIGSLWILSSLFLFSACGGGYNGSQHPTAIKIGKPYIVRGVRYYPHYDPDYNEVGYASWYGPGFHGKMTASGEQYDQSEMTAAHKTLPMPSFLRVTRMDNGDSIIVRVNDRGPFEDGRIIDLSHGSAKALNLIGHGVVKVRAEYLSDETEQYIAELGLKKPPEWYDNPYAVNDAEPAPVGAVLVQDASNNNVTENVFTSPLAVQSQPAIQGAGQDNYLIQAGAFAVKRNADLRADALSAIASAVVQEVVINGKTLYRVLLGPVNDRQMAEQLLTQAQNSGAKEARIVVE